MAFKLKQEKEIREAVQKMARCSSDGKMPPEARKFVARLNDEQRWEVEFTYLGSAGYRLGLKRGGVRMFSTLDAVRVCLQELGVEEFSVMCGSN